jgi:hypothetical protein
METNDKATVKGDNHMVTQIEQQQQQRINAMVDDYDWKEAFEYADFLITDVVEIIAMEEGDNDGDDWIGVFKLSNGQFAWLSAGCDYTGWDCQATGDSAICNTLDELLRGYVGEQNAKRLGLSLDLVKV